MSQLVIQLHLIKMKPVAASVTTEDAKWDESKHPRKHGQFAPNGSGTTGKTGSKTGGKKSSSKGDAKLSSKVGKKSSSNGGKKRSNTRFSKKDLQEMKRGTSPKYADKAASRMKKLLQKYAKKGLVM